MACGLLQLRHEHKRRSQIRNSGEGRTLFTLSATEKAKQTQREYPLLKSIYFKLNIFLYFFLWVLFRFFDLSLPLRQNHTSSAPQIRSPIHFLLEER